MSRYGHFNTWFCRLNYLHNQQGSFGGPRHAKFGVRVLTSSSPRGASAFPASPVSNLRRKVKSYVISVFFFTTGFILHDILKPAQALELFKPDDETALDIDQHIQSHPLALSLRADPNFSESRPHLKIPDVLRVHNLTGGTLAGDRKLVVPPVIWNQKDGKSLVSICFIGEDLCGYPGIVHGGLLATLLDEGLARCCFPALPHKIAMTANLSVNYRKPAPAGRYYVLRAKTLKVEGRKAWVEGHIETLEDEGKEPTIVADASALYIEPKNAALRLFPVA